MRTGFGLKSGKATQFDSELKEKVSRITMAGKARMTKMQSGADGGAIDLEALKNINPDDEDDDEGFGIQRMGAEEEEEDEFDDDGVPIPKKERTVVGALVHGQIVNLEEEENQKMLAEMIKMVEDASDYPVQLELNRNYHMVLV